MPTLVTVGLHDEIIPACAETLHRGVPGAEMRVFKESAHVAHLEETEAIRGGGGRFPGAGRGGGSSVKNTMRGRDVGD